MARSKLVDYFLRPGALPVSDVGVLIDVDSGTVYTAIEAILGTTGRSFWDTDTDYANGRSRMTALAASLLMDASNRIIRALWDMRGNLDTSQTPTEEGLYPLPTDSNSLYAILLQLSDMQADDIANWGDLQNRMTEVQTTLEEIAAASGGFTAEEKLQLFSNLASIIAAL